MNRVLCILKDLESGITLMKDKDDTKNWTEKDLKRMKKKNVVMGYDVAYNNEFVILDLDNVQYMYLVEKDPEKISGEESTLDIEEDGDSMKWRMSSPQPNWSESDNGVMFQ